MGVFDEIAPAVAGNPAARQPSAPSVFDDLAPAVSVGQPRQAETPGEYARAGFQASALGLAWRGKLPDLVMNPEHAKWWERAITGITQVAAELPLMIPGAMLGAPAGAAIGGAITGPAAPVGAAVGGILGGGAGMFALPGAVRESLMQAYQSGEITTPAEWWNIVREVAKATGKEAAVGAVTMGAGSVAARVVGRAVAPVIGQSISVPAATKVIGTADVAAQIGGMVSMPAAFEGRMPGLMEFMDAAIVIGGLKTAHVVADRIARTYVRTGKTPAEQVADARADPKVAEDLTAPAEVSRETSSDPIRIQESLFTETKRLTELETKATGTPEQTITGPEGKPVTVPGRLAEYLTDAERQERDTLKARVATLEARLTFAKEFETSTERVSTAFRQALERADEARVKNDLEPFGQEYSKTITDYMMARIVNRAKRLGMTPEEVYKEQFLRVEAGFWMPDARLETPEFRTGLEKIAKETRAAMPAAPGKIASLMGDVLDLGGIDARELRDVTGDSKISKGIPANLFRKGGRGLDELARDLRTERGWDIAQDSTDSGVRALKAMLVAEIQQPGTHTRLADAEAVGRKEQRDRDQFETASIKKALAGERMSHAEEEVVAEHLDALERLGQKGYDEARIEVLKVPELTTKDIVDVDAVARASEVDPDAVERAAIQHEANDAGFMVEIRRILDESGASTDAGRQAAERETARILAAIARDSTPAIQEAVADGRLTQEAALAISTAAPGNEASQAIGARVVMEGNSLLYAVNLMRAVDQVRGEKPELELSQIPEAEALAEAATQRQMALAREARGEAGVVPETPAELAARDAEAIAQAKGDTLYQSAPTWYSELSRQIEASKMNAAPAKGWKDFIRGLSQKGVKPDEVKWSGIEEYLDAQPGKVTKEQIRAFLEQGGVKVEEVMLGGPGEKSFGDAEDIRILNDHGFRPETNPENGRTLGIFDRESGDIIDAQTLRNWYRQPDPNAEPIPLAVVEAAERIERDWGLPGKAPTTKFGQWQLPGGQNYRELLLTLPDVTADQKASRILESAGLKLLIDGANRHVVDGTGKRVNPQDGDPDLRARSGRDATDLEQRAIEAARAIKEGDSRFTQGHFDQPNVLAHIRFNERTDADGKRVLFVEEIQSDWGQKGKKEGFAKKYTKEEADKFTVEDSMPDPAAPPELRAHGMWSEADFLYFRDKGYTDQEIRAFWDRDLPRGDGPVEHPGYLRRRAANRDYIVRDAEGRELARAPGHLNDSAEDAITTVRRTAMAGTLKMSAVPSAPFVTKTDAWTALALKRMIRYGAENGFERIAWTRGEQQVERYTSALRKVVDSIEWEKTPEGVQLVGWKGKRPPEITAMPTTGNPQRVAVVWRNDAGDFTRTYYGDRSDAEGEIARRAPSQKVVDTRHSENDLSDAIGKAMADRIIKDPAQKGTIEGENINIDDTGMAGYYDRIVPKVANEVLKKLGGGKVGEVSLKMPGVETDTIAGKIKSYGQKEQPGFDITPELREKAQQGMPLFQRQQEIHRAAYSIAEKQITLFKTADRSSIIHELGHDWLQEMKQDAARPDAPQQIKDDWQILRQEFAIPEEGPIPVISHEQFAKTHERYTAEGHAPSTALRAIFDRFKAWMLEIYKSISGLPDIKPEIREVFDRMLASDEQIRQAQEMGVPRAYVEAATAERTRQIIPGDKARQAANQPFADDLPKGPGEAPDTTHVNYAYINSPMDVKLAMQRMAEIDQENIQTQRGGTEGVKSWADSNAEQARYLNDILGGNADTLKLLAPRDPNAPGVDVRLGILKKLAVGAAKDSSRLRDVILEKGPNATVREQLEYLGSIERARMIQAEFLGERATVARALNALKDVTEGTGEIGRMLEVIGTGEQKLFQGPKTPAEEAAELKRRLDEILLQYNGKTVLDIAKLHKEIGTLKGSFKFSKDVTQATTWEMVIEGWKSSLLSGPVTHTTNLFGTGAFMALRAPVDALAAGIGLLRGARVGTGESDRASMMESVSRLTGMLGGTMDALKVGYHTFQLDSPTGKTEAYRTAIPGRAGELIRIPLRLMGAEDAIVSTMYRRGEMKTLAVRQAFSEGMNPLTREFAERVDRLMDNPTPEMAAEADLQATRMTFNSPLGEKGVTLQLFVNRWNLQWMIPFIRTPINIAKELARMSPAAPLVGEWRAAIAKGGIERDRALAELALGSGIMAIAMAYAFEGTLTGSGSPDPGKNRGKAGVEQPYSMLKDGVWYEYARIQPVGTLVGMATDLANVWDHLTPEEMDKIPKMLAIAFSNAVTNQTFLQGIVNFTNAMSDPTRFAPRFFQGLAGSMVPNIIAQPVAMMDPLQREVNSMLDAVRARLPGREDLEPKRDWLGESTPTRERLGVVLPSRTLEVSTDKVRLEAARLDISMAAAPRKTHIGKGTGKLGDVEFTPEERSRFAKEGGEMAHKILTNIVNQEGWDAMPDMIKRKIYGNVLSASHRFAAVMALPMDKRMGYLQEITEKVAQQLNPQ